MLDIVNNYIEEARRYQSFGDYEMSVASLNKASQSDRSKEHEVEIQKLLCLCYRKMEDYDMALYHINNAINANTKHVQTPKIRNERAVCLMNKGIVYEVSNRPKNAEECYRTAVNIFEQLHKGNSANYGIIINAMLTFGMFYYNQGEYKQSIDILERSLLYFGPEKESDRRFLAIQNSLEEMKQKIGAWK